MSLTYRDICSRVRSLLKMNSSDEPVSDRMMLREVLSANLKLTTQQLQQRKGWTSPNLFTMLTCIPMEEIPLYSCCDTTSDCKIARSKIDIPQIVDCNYNLVVQGVWSLDRKYRYKEIGTPNRYADYIKLYPNPKDKFFWMQENKLYITDSNIEKVSLSAFFMEPIDPAMYACDYKDNCVKNPIDLEFKSLPKLEDDVINIVVDRLNKTYNQSTQDIQEDDKPNK